MIPKQTRALHGFNPSAAISLRKAMLNTEFVVFLERSEVEYLQTGCEWEPLNLGFKEKDKNRVILIFE